MGNPFKVPYPIKELRIWKKLNLQGYSKEEISKILNEFREARNDDNR